MLRFSVILFALAAFGADPKLDGFLSSVEARYNHAKTLEVPFTEKYTPPGRFQRSESGMLLLRKPGKMRGDYDQPKGKMFVADGTYLYLFSPDENLAHKVKLNESFGEDVRAPLAFLLGRLDFKKEFKDLQGHPDGANTRITASPKGDALPYSAVEFLITPDYRIQELKITLADHSLIGFTFGREVMNPTLSDKLFTFQLPPGAHWDPGTGQ